MKKTVLLGVTGGVAVVKLFDLLHKFSEKDYVTEVILSRAAEAFVDVSAIEKIINKKVYTSLFSEKVDVEGILEKRKVEHIELAGRANVIVIAPATANIIAKLANGIADDYLTTVVLASTCSVIVCPSMNVHMWHHAATQKNVQTLRSMGYIVIEPDSGMLACGYEGQGRLASIDVIAKETAKILHRSDTLQGKKVIVTAGGTKEPIDDIRYITNRSSGKMGSAIAESLFLRGADIIFLCTKSSVRPRYNIQTHEFETAKELEKLLQSMVKNADYIFQTAAVSDFSVKKKKGKISSDFPVTLSLVPQEKIINNIKKWNQKIILVAFKAESNSSEKNLIIKSEEKLQESQADFVVANDTGKKDRGFEVDTNEVFVVAKNGDVTKIPLASKKEIADKIVDIIFTNGPKVSKEPEEPKVHSAKK